MEIPFKPQITVFHCINAFIEKKSLSSGQADVKTIRMPCSGMVTEVYLLKAFEAGADAVAVLVCPGGACRYTEGNLRAEKRMGKTRSVLDEIGVDIKTGDYIGVQIDERHCAYWSVENDGRDNYSNKHLAFGTIPYYRSITCRPADEFNI